MKFKFALCILVAIASILNAIDNGTSQDVVLNVGATGAVLFLFYSTVKCN